MQGRAAGCCRLFIMAALALFLPNYNVSAERLAMRLFASEGRAVPPAFAMGISLPSAALLPNAQLEGARKPVSRGNAMLRSLVLPGWGESYLGYHGAARYFFWADMALWASVIGLEVYSRWKQDQFISFAATHSGAQMQGKDDAFYADVGNYLNTEAYNEAKLRYRDFAALYTDPAYYWAWDSDSHRSEYDHLRIQSRTAHNRIFFFIGAAILNRLISTIDSGKKANDLLRGQNRPSLGFSIEPPRDDVPAQLSLRAQF